MRFQSTSSKPSPRMSSTSPGCAYLAAYRAIKPKMNGREIPTRPATAIGIFSSSDILSVFLYGRANSHFKEGLDRERDVNIVHVHTASSFRKARRTKPNSRLKIILRFRVSRKRLSFLFIEDVEFGRGRHASDEGFRSQVCLGRKGTGLCHERRSDRKKSIRSNGGLHLISSSS